MCILVHQRFPWDLWAISLAIHGFFLEKNTFIQGEKKQQQKTCSRRRNVSWWSPIQHQQQFSSVNPHLPSSTSPRSLPCLGKATQKFPKIPGMESWWFHPNRFGKTNGFFATTWRHDVWNPKHRNWISNHSRSRENRRFRWEFWGGRKTST